MAQKVLVQLIDDLDGTAAEEVEAISFGLDGVAYDIDLKPGNAARLREALADFIAGARRTRGRVKRATNTERTIVAESRTKDQTRAIRQWARSNGHELADRGRIPAAIIEEFEKAHR
ncbi:histone-like nucleoid-structuring protein Lsr2 [Lentzea sp. NEAU-D7]|uniref:histone-like nucleoid-structuring protein Lsr2 n=1 Tax=Lentzea sp. NEAU-D7 TaxID=2994667 RepID=UPI00224B3486|nr:Lsr2 family protein [Lentzea sp. NEAU-D7]MCX2954527.1 Lsr2 family protein [Lentzea sp. NEAU-D7]